MFRATKIKREPSNVKIEKCVPFEDEEFQENRDFDDDNSGDKTSRSNTAERVRRVDTEKKTNVKASRILKFEKFDDNYNEKSSARSYVKNETIPREKTHVSPSERYSDERPASLSGDIECLAKPKFMNGGLEYSSANKMMALFCLQDGNELEAIGYLIKSHAIFLQSTIYHRYNKTMTRNKFYPVADIGLKPYHMIYDTDTRSKTIGKSLKAKLAQLPEEWYMIQLTTQYEGSGIATPESAVVSKMCPLHLTVLPTGPNAIDPFCITIPQLETDEYDGVKEVVNILKNNKDDLETKYESNEHYWNMRGRQNSKMKVAMMVGENEWLREWRILLMADPVENSSLVKEMIAMIDKLIADDLSINKISPRSRWLLRKIATSCSYLTKAEIARAVHQVIGDNKKLASNVILSIYGKLMFAGGLSTEKRKSLILILDEGLDHIPFESMTVLTNHPATRFPSFQVVYAMFKEHETTIVKGCKVINITNELGSFIVNPGGDLIKTEKRMKLFIDYWLPKWKGTYSIKPDETAFENSLINHDILMYIGHGSGIQYMPGNRIERLNIRALPMLFGCSSVRLSPTGGRYPPLGISNRYMTASSPCVLGALWEITDGDIDKLTASFISNWIPSTVNKPWSDVDSVKWIGGSLAFKTFSTSKNNIAPTKSEPEMLRAIANAKKVCTQHMTAAAIVVRGLPIRLV